MNFQDNIFNLRKKSTSSKHFNPVTMSKSSVNDTNLTSNLNYPFQLFSNPLLQTYPEFLQRPSQSSRIKSVDPIVLAQNNFSRRLQPQENEENVTFANLLPLLPDSFERVYLPSACSSIQVYYPPEKYIFFLNSVLMLSDSMAKIRSISRLNSQWLLFIGFDSEEKFSSYAENLLSLEKIAENSQSNEEFFPLVVDLDSKLIYGLFMENLEEREYYGENYAYTNMINTSSYMESNYCCENSYDPRNLALDVEMN